MERANSDIRATARKNKVPLWAIANELGISEPTMTRRLRVEMNEGDKRKVMEAIKCLSEQEVQQGADENN